MNDKYSVSEYLPKVERPRRISFMHLELTKTKKEPNFLTL